MALTAIRGEWLAAMAKNGYAAKNEVRAMAEELMQWRQGVDVKKEGFKELLVPKELFEKTPIALTSTNLGKVAVGEYSYMRWSYGIVNSDFIVYRTR